MHYYSTNIASMYSDKMKSRVIRQKFESTRLFEVGESKTLIGINDTHTHAFISHNLGISWKQIDGVSGSSLVIKDCGNGFMIISDRNTGRIYVIDGRGNVTKECIFEQEWYEASVHPEDTNAILLHSFKSDNACSDEGILTVYYTKDGGASEWKVLREYDILFESEHPSCKFITGGARDLIYVYDMAYENYMEYFNFFSESPSKPRCFPFEVHRTQDIFYGIKNQKELHVSTDGIDFEYIQFPSHSSSWDYKNIVDGVTATSDWGDWEYNIKRAKGSLFLQRRYKIKDGLSEINLPRYTLFRYDVKRKEIKTMLDYCYDYLVVSPEEGIMIANYITNPQGCVYHKEKPKIRTVITFNDGANWEPMRGPNGGEFSVAISNSLSRSFGDIPSNASLIIVCGKEGPLENYQEFNPNSDFLSSLSTYMTKDSGRSWRKINDDAMNYMIGDSDNIIIMFREGQEYILYSLDGGMNWQKRTIGKVDLRCWDSSSSSNSKRFLLGDCTISFDPTDQLEQSYL